MALSHLVLGGARSGKSRFAVSLQPARGRVVFVATAERGDRDMVARIARHQAERPRGWRTIEAPHGLTAVLDGLGDQADAVIVDCLTVWVANLLLRGDSDAAILAQADELAMLVTRDLYDLTLVSNEVGEGVHPETTDGLRFRDLLGLVNQRIAAACQRVTLMVAGIPLAVKTPLPSHDIVPQAP